MFLIFLVGTAGSGKSLLTFAFASWLKMKEKDIITVNLDPGVLSLPYTPDVDIRDYISINHLMERYGLGPNGAMIMAADLIATRVNALREEIEDFKSDYVIVDTPGQMELFAFRASGPYIVSELTSEPKAIIYLFDALFSSDPLNYVSNMFLSAAVYNRFLSPQIHVLSKVDLLPRRRVKEILDWSAKGFSLETAIEERLSGAKRLLSRDVVNAIFQLGLAFHLIPVSAKTEEGFVNLFAMLTRIFKGGEEV